MQFLDARMFVLCINNQYWVIILGRDRSHANQQRCHTGRPWALTLSWLSDHQDLHTCLCFGCLISR